MSYDYIPLGTVQSQYTYDIKSSWEHGAEKLSFVTGEEPNDAIIFKESFSAPYKNEHAAIVRVDIFSK
jgi:hypothetical protein